MRFQGEYWDLEDPKGSGKIGTWQKVGVAVLMDIREELKTLNRLLSCPNFQSIPRRLRQIAANTTKPKRKK